MRCTHRLLCISLVRIVRRHTQRDVRPRLRLDHTAQSPDRKSKHSLLESLVHVSSVQLADVPAPAVSSAPAVAHFTCQLTHELCALAAVLLAQSLQHLRQNVVCSICRSLANSMSIRVSPRRWARGRLMLDQEMQDSVSLCRRNRCGIWIQSAGLLLQPPRALFRLAAGGCFGALRAHG